MCIECPNHHQSSSGVSAKGIVTTLAAAVTVVATYRILEVAWPLLLTVWVVAALWVWVPASRPLLRAAAASPVLLIAWWLRRRRTARPPADVAAAYAWRVSVYEPTGGTNRVLTRGTVEGPWRNATEVEAAAIAYAVQEFGYEQAGHLRAHAQPAVTR